MQALADTRSAPLRDSGVTGYSRPRPDFPMNSMMMNLAPEEVANCLSRLAQGERVPVVLRELGKKYGVTRSTLGFFIADLASENCLEATQAVWTWDVSQTGKGMSDEQLEAELNSLGVRFGPR